VVFCGEARSGETDVIKRLKVNGYQSLVDAEIHFNPLTVLLGRNGAGKSALLDSLERLGSYARGGVERAFGTPPYSLGFLRSHGHGDMPVTSFEVDLLLNGNDYRYRLSLAERQGHACVEEERVIRLSTGEVLAAWSRTASPASGTILRPDAPDATLEKIAAHLKSVRIFDLSPRDIEKPSEEEQSTLGRDGFGVGAYLGRLWEEEPARFADLEKRLHDMRPGTKALRVWGGAAGQVYWGVEDHEEESWRCPAPLLSWGDRLLVGVLCVLFATEEGCVVGLEEVDRGYHPSRYEAIVELLSEAAYHGIGGRGPLQIIATSHSPALVSRFHDRLDELRLIRRTASGATTVLEMKDEVKARLGHEQTSAPIGEVWAMGLLD
jgi:AAA domain, putative AbiEii toxin, Type IV TA system